MGTWSDPSGTVRGRRGGGRGQTCPETPAMAPSRARGKRAQRGTLARSLREAGRNLAGRFEDDSRASWRRKRRQTKPATSAMARNLAMRERARRVRWSTGRAAASRWSVERVWVHALMAKPFRGVHLNPARQRAVPSQVHSHRFRHPRVNR